MKAEKWLILGALAGLAAVQINKQLRLARQRVGDELPDVEDASRSSVDDVPTVQPAAETAQPGAPTVAAVESFDEKIAPAAPF